MSFSFNVSNVPDSFNRLFHYTAKLVSEQAWLKPMQCNDESSSTSIKFSNPRALPKDIKANSEPFSTLTISMNKPYGDTFDVNLSFDSKKAPARFREMFHDRNKEISENFFSMINNIPDCELKIQQKTSFQKQAFARYVDILVLPAEKVTVEQVLATYDEILKESSDAPTQLDGKKVKSQGPCVTLHKSLPISDLGNENSLFDTTIKELYKFIISEQKIQSEEEEKQSRSEKGSFLKKNSYPLIVSNRQGEEFYCRLKPADFARCADRTGVEVWSVTSLEQKKYFKEALKIVKEL
jgi:hypothetical protein